MSGNTTLGAATGIIGGITKYLTIVPVHSEFWIKLTEAGGTALVCGFLGVLGKECFMWTKAAIIEYFINRKNRGL